MGVSNGLGICEHASSAFVFANTGRVIKFVLRAVSTLDCEQSLFSSKIQEIQMACSEHFVNFFTSRNLSFI